MGDSTVREQVIAKIKQGRAIWDQLLKEVGPSRINEPGVVGQWSVKDLTAHLSTWEGRALAWTEAVLVGTRPEPAPWNKQLSEEGVNAWIYAKNHDRPTSEIIEDSRMTTRRLLEALALVPDEVWDEPKRFEWLGNATLADALPGNTYEHYLEHAEYVRTWLERQKAVA